MEPTPQVLWQRFDDHQKLINDVQKEMYLTEHRLSELEKFNKDISGQIAATKSEITTLVSSQFKSLESSITQIQSTLSEEKGAKNASQRGVGLILSLIAILPTIAIIIMSLNNK